MTFADAFLPEFDQEMKTTRALLERVPLDRWDWKPHPKSTALGSLAAHIAALAGFGGRIVARDEIDTAAGSNTAAQQKFTETEKLLAAFDANAAASRDALAGMPDAAAGTPWTLRNGDHVIFTLPRSAVLRTMLLNHLIHHRGQLSVYLRLNDVPLPSIYGPTADT